VDRELVVPGREPQLHLEQLPERGRIVGAKEETPVADVAGE
jgi:hypothetical protein